jgi:chlorite dismutase
MRTTYSPISVLGTGLLRVRDYMEMVPYTLEGAFVLHQMIRVRWAAWKALDPESRQAVITEAIHALAEFPPQRSALFSMLGHKGDLMFLHFRDSLAELSQAELALAKLDLMAYLEPTSSYTSVIELGLYESTGRIRKLLAEKGLKPGSEEWTALENEELGRQRVAMAPRLNSAIPDAPYLCFYPMDRKRGEEKNWYTVPWDERVRMMHDHGMIGRKYAGIVKQIITGSIGFDDWEWGVDLFAEDPLQFKKLIYEMRFDEVSAVYALFGTFYISVRTQFPDLGKLLA